MRVFAAIVLCSSLPLSAASIYDDGTNSLAIGGWAGLALVNSDSDNQLVDSSSRLNLQFQRKLTGNWHAESKLEWGFNLVDRGDSISLNGDSLQAGREGQFLFNRLGYVAFTHPQYGRFSAGKQWSVYSDVAGFTDNFFVTGGLALGIYNFNTDGGLSGTGRADSALQYRQQWGNLKIGLQYQARTEDSVGAFLPEECEVAMPPPECTDFIELQDLQVQYDDSWGAKISYQSGLWYAGLAVNRGDLDPNQMGIDDEDAAMVGTLMYGKLYQPGWFGVISHARSEGHELDSNNRGFDGHGSEMMLAWTNQHGLSLVAGINSLQSDDRSYEQANGKFKRELYVTGIHYFWGEGTLFFAEVKIDNSEIGVNKEDEQNVYGTGVRFIF
ncbi:porin [uncultured Ferrimonas sp.]|uniref:porin n=1 Tax=uncultured Ferrimonas sp. TaxID=432640 RepID=UPI002630E9EC|nr:porin [uncultured Ferrimonas sp.]